MGKRTAILLIAVAALAAPAVAQSGKPVRVTTVAPSRPTPGAPAPARSLLADSLGGVGAAGPVESLDAGSVAFAEDFGLADAALRHYESSTVTVYRTANEALGYALARTVRPEAAGPVEVGAEGWSSGEKTAFWLGPYAVVVEGPTAEARQALATALATRMGKPLAPAPLLAHLPKTGQVAGTAHYAPSATALRALRQDLSGDAFSLEAGGAEAAVASYEQPGGAPLSLTIVEYQTPQLAAVAERQFRTYFDALPADVRAHRLLKREGNYLVEATGILDEASARGALDAVDYAYEVKWLKDLPPPPVGALDAREEAQKVAQVLISSFAIVGIGVLTAATFGILFGAGIFRLRRRAVGNTYSDAGGMVCLDLDPALPPTASAGLLAAKTGED